VVPYLNGSRGSGGVEVVLEGLARQNIRFTGEFS
jgi:hypothetical protein